MKIEVVGGGVKKTEYPRLMMVSGTNVIVLVSDIEFGSGVGSVIRGDEVYPTGYHAEDFDMTEMVDFAGVISLQNDGV